MLNGSHTVGVRVVLADDHPIVLSGIRGVLGSQSDFDIVGMAANGADALRLIRELEPDAAILDISMPELDGIEILEAVEREGHASRIVFLTATATDSQITAAVRGGVWGILLKDAAAMTLVDCLRSVISGKRWLPTNLIDPAFRREIERTTFSGAVDDCLTPREHDLVALVAEGLSNKHIARRLLISEGTVKNHLHNIYRKVGVANRTSLACLARGSG